MKTNNDDDDNDDEREKISFSFSSIQEVVYAKINPKPSRDSACPSIIERPGQTEQADDVTYSEVKFLYPNPN